MNTKFLHINKKTRSILSVFCIALSLIMVMPSVKVHAGGVGKGGGQDPAPHGSVTISHDDSGSGEVKPKHSGGGSGSGSVEEPEVPYDYDPTDGWGTWSNVSKISYAKNDAEYISINTQTCPGKPQYSTTYNWTLEFKKMIQDSYGLLEHKVNTENTWTYYIYDAGYYLMKQMPIIHCKKTTYTRTETIITYTINNQDMIQKKAPKRTIVLGPTETINEYDSNGSEKNWEGRKRLSFFIAKNKKTLIKVPL